MLWHWLDKRLQSQQEVQEAGDRSFSYAAEYRVAAKQFIRLADEDVRTVTVAPKQRYAIGQDDREYELVGNLDGRRFQDIYVIDMQTGERKLALKRARWYNGPSPDGKSFLYYDDGNYHVYAMESGQSRSITQGAPVSFVDSENDHNVIRPPAGTIGWTRDSASVLLSDRRIRSAISGGSHSSRRRSACWASTSTRRNTSRHMASGRRRPESPGSRRASRASRR